ncbi:MAG: hypothetical protein HY796_09795, partial [Elusimicrobia bacterium]|nr:hypothetical protein [Elusimicrobiota bacterium]
MKKLALAMTAAILASPLGAEINFDNPKFNLADELPAMELSLPGPAAAGENDSRVRPDKEWTVMVFVNAKNNLERYGMLDMNEMEMIGSTDKVNVVVELGRIAGYDSSDGNWVGSRRYLVKKDGNTGKITSPVVQDLGKVDMGDYKHLIDFAVWARTNYPARKYMLIVWNHGSGWLKSVGGQKGISYDDETGNHINTPQLGLAMKAIGKVDVYGSDACLMQMPEVNYEIKDYVDYIVGSEETEPGDGYTYNLLLGPLAAKPAMGAQELGKLAVDAYSDHYQSISQESTQSLVKSAAHAGFVPLVNDFVKAALASGEKALVKTALSGTQSYAYSDNKDL